MDISPILLKMKTLVLFAVVMAIRGGCRLFKSDDPEPKTELEKLPPITQEGKNTFGCLVNGTAFVVTNTSNMVTIYQGGSLELSGGIYIDKKVMTYGFLLVNSWNQINHLALPMIQIEQENITKNKGTAGFPQGQILLES
jgi:hypothetical protein